MRLLFLGDIVGRAARTAVIEKLPAWRRDLALDFVIVNGENAAGGFGITPAIAQDLFKAGADCITTGNHAWDQKEIMGYIDGEPRLLRPLNYPAATPGRGFYLYDAPRGRKVLVINAMARVFMSPLDNPFHAVDAVLKRHPLGTGQLHAAVLDFHGEATSEKMAMGHFCDGRMSLVVGTHSHVPTADAQVLPGGTAYQTDAGMCGDYDSVIGMEKTEPVRGFVQQYGKNRFSPAGGEPTVCGLLVETDDRTGLAKKIEPVRQGGRLAQQMPRLAQAAE